MRLGKAGMPRFKTLPNRFAAWISDAAGVSAAFQTRNPQPLPTQPVLQNDGDGQVFFVAEMAL